MGALLKVFVLFVALLCLSHGQTVTPSPTVSPSLYFVDMLSEATQQGCGQTPISPVLLAYRPSLTGPLGFMPYCVSAPICLKTVFLLWYHSEWLLKRCGCLWLCFFNSDLLRRVNVAQTNSISRSTPHFAQYLQVEIVSGGPPELYVPRHEPVPYVSQGG